MTTINWKRVVGVYNYYEHLYIGEHNGKYYQKVQYTTEKHSDVYTEDEIVEISKEKFDNLIARYNQ